MLYLNRLLRKMNKRLSRRVDRKRAKVWVDLNEARAQAVRMRMTLEQMEMEPDELRNQRVRQVPEG